MLKNKGLPIPQNQNQSTTGALIALSLATLISSLAISSVNIALPELSTNLNATFGDVQWVIISYIMVLTATLVIAGRLTDTFGRKKLFLIGVILFTTSAGICGLTQNLWTLVFVRAIQGSGAAILIAVNMVIVSDVFPKNRIGSAIGLIGSMSAIGTASGPVLGGLILESLNWQAIFLINIPLGVVTYLLGRKYLPQDILLPINISESFNHFSAFFLFLIITTYTLSIKLTKNGFDMINIILLGILLLGILLFTAIERNSNAPLIKISLLREIGLLPSLISNFIISTVVMSSLVISPFYLTIALELNAIEAGLVMAASPLTVAISSNIVGRIADKYDLSNIILFGLFTITFGAIGMSVLKVSSGLLNYVVCLLIIGAGYATFLAANNTFTMKSALQNVRGSISGILNFSRNLGLLTGASLMSVVFVSVSQISDTSRVNSHLLETGLHAVYKLAVALLLIAIAIQLLTKYRCRKNK